MYCLDKNTNTLCAGKVEKDQQATIRPVEEESPDIKLKSDLACKKSRKISKLQSDQWICISYHCKQEESLAEHSHAAKFPKEQKNQQPHLWSPGRRWMSNSSEPGITRRKKISKQARDCKEPGLEMHSGRGGDSEVLPCWVCGPGMDQWSCWCVSVSV